MSNNHQPGKWIFLENQDSPLFPIKLYRPNIPDDKVAQILGFRDYNLNISYVSVVCPMLILQAPEFSG